MKLINITEAKTHLLRFVDDAAPRELGLGRDRFNIPADFDHRDQAAVEAMFYGTKE